MLLLLFGQLYISLYLSTKLSFYLRYNFCSITISIFLNIDRIINDLDFFVGSFIYNLLPYTIRDRNDFSDRFPTATDVKKFFCSTIQKNMV